MAQKTTLQEFESVFPKLQEALLEHAKSYKLPQEQLDWYRKVGAAQWTALAWVKKAAMANTTPGYRVSKSTHLAENAIAACRCRTRCPSYWDGGLLRTSTSKRLHSGG